MKEQNLAMAVCVVHLLIDWAYDLIVFRPQRLEAKLMLEQELDPR